MIELNASSRCPVVPNVEVPGRQQKAEKWKVSKLGREGAEKMEAFEHCSTCEGYLGRKKGRRGVRPVSDGINYPFEFSLETLGWGKFAPGRGAARSLEQFLRT
jgi:hypothetical protein